MKNLSILIVDDHLLVRSGIKSLLKDQSDIEIIAEAGSGEEAIEICETLKPDVILMDISLPGISGLETTRILKEKHPEFIVLILTMHEEKEYIFNALKTNINGILHKSAGKDEIINALHTVSSGKRYYGRKVSDVLVGTFLEKFPEEETEPVSVTKREKEILMLISGGLNSNEIADSLMISVRTVETHRSNLIQKFHLKNSAGLIKFANQFASSQK